jgi:hypothetical protein
MKNNIVPAIFLICLISLVFLISPIISLAEYKIEVGLPTLPKGSTITDPGQYIQAFFTFGLYLLSFLAVGFIALGGIMWMLAAGNPGRIDKAKEMIVGALSGLVLLLCSYLILKTIDPSLVNIKAPTLNQYDVQK